MTTRLTLLAAACALTLSACGGSSAPDTPDAAPSAAAPAPTGAPAAAPAPDTAPPAMAPAAAPAAMAPAADGGTPANGKPAAEVSDCGTTIEGTDAMQYSVSSIAVPASCKDFKITLKHTGKLPAAAMGHDVVISKAADMEAVDADGRAAGAEAGYVKAGDARVVAHTKLIGGGETTSMTFPVDKIKDGGPYVFFCSFPGHSALMKGSITVQ